MEPAYQQGFGLRGFGFMGFADVCSLRDKGSGHEAHDLHVLPKAL